MKDPRSDVDDKASDIHAREEPLIDTFTHEDQTTVYFVPDTSSNRTRGRISFGAAPIRRRRK